MDKQSLLIWSFILLLLFIGIIQWGNYLITNHYIVENFKNKNFISNDSGISTTHTVNMPLTTTVSCQNFCGPQNRCYITGEQCIADVDCYGCHPDKEKLNNDTINYSGYNEDNTNMTTPNNIVQNVSNFIYKNTGINQNDNNSGSGPGFSGSTVVNAVSNSLTGNFFDNSNIIDDPIRGQNDAGKLTTEINPTYSVLTTDIGTRSKLVNDPHIQPPQYFKGVNQWRETFDAGEELFDKRYNPNSQQFTLKYPQRTTLSGEFIDNGPLAANDYLK